MFTGMVYLVAPVQLKNAILAKDRYLIGNRYL